MNYFQSHASRWIAAENNRTAPHFLQTFHCSAPRGIIAAISGLGYYELYINGRKVGDHVLDPAVSVYDRHVRYVTYDVSDYLKKGINAVGVILGNGWYNNSVKDVWNFASAHWMSCPKFRLEMKSQNGKLLLASDQNWRWSEGPITFNELRNGEFYDARLELGDWVNSGTDTSDWPYAVLAAAPGGILEEQTALPCKIYDTVPLHGPNNQNVYAADINLAGHCRIQVSGKRGAVIRLSHAERITDDGQLLLNMQCECVQSGKFQHDEYTLKGEGVETWEPRFTYHGFQYVHADYDHKDVTLHKIEARCVGTGFDSVGEFESGNPMADLLHILTRVSYRANFVGIPTDCPHREKNGWTGDAQLASETGLYNFNGAPSYLQWIDTMRDCQRPSGEFPGIAPSCGWGYNWGNGPCWDSAFFVVPWHVYLYTGDDSALKKHYNAMRLYLDFCESRAIDHIIQWGLGDWCPPCTCTMVDTRLSSTACYYGDIEILRKTALLLNKKSDADALLKLSGEVKDMFNRAYYRGKGIYADGGMTALATALYFDFCPSPADKKKTVSALVSLVKKQNCTAQFGILGAKYVPRVLADNGHADLACHILLQDQFPGWGNWVRRGASSLWENWDGVASRNHIMFGDISAWFFRYAAGFRHDESAPGWKELCIEPHLLEELGKCRAVYRGYVCQWAVEHGKFRLMITVPRGCRAVITLPDGQQSTRTAGTYEYQGTLK